MSNKSKLFIDWKGISHLRMKKTKSVRVVQHSRTLLRGWRPNSTSSFYYIIQIQIVLISEIEDVLDMWCHTQVKDTTHHKPR
jgi:hypothetical protein